MSIGTYVNFDNIRGSDLFLLVISFDKVVSTARHSHDEKDQLQSYLTNLAFRIRQIVVYNLKLSEFRNAGYKIYVGLNLINQLDWGNRKHINAKLHKTLTLGSVQIKASNKIIYTGTFDAVIYKK